MPTDEEDASAQRAKLRKEMGEELYKQYFPNEVAEEEDGAGALEEAKKSLEKIKGMRHRKNKKVDFSDWNI
jgi:hypothetical protein